jgi:CheY-specific phosphatase CheX
VNLDVDRSRLTGVAPEIWDMMLALQLDPLASPPAEMFPEGESSITGLVTVDGDWTGAIAVQTSSAAARRFAAAMFLSDDLDGLSTDEVHDAQAELTNMTGGNIKNLLPGVCKIGIPSVTEGTGYVVKVPRTAPIHKLVYRSLDDYVLVTVFEAIG